MFEHLPKKTYDALVDAIDNNKKTLSLRSRRQWPQVRSSGPSTTVRATITHWSPSADRRHWGKALCPVEHDGKGAMAEEITRAGATRHRSPTRRASPNGEVYATHSEARGYFGLGHIVACVHPRQDSLYPDNLHRLYRRIA